MPTAEPQSKKVLIIANPVAGGYGGRNRLDQALRHLTGHFPQSEMRWTDRRGDAERWAQEAVEDKINLVIGAGGDGTLNEIINGLAETEVAFAIIPSGTANVVARELDIPLDPLEAAKIIVHGYTDKIHIGRAEYQPLPREQQRTAVAETESEESSTLPEHRLFLFGAGVGFDAYACLRVNLQIKHFARAAAYIFDGVRLLFKYRSPKLEVITDNHPPIQCAEIIVSNTRHYAGQFKIAPEASIHDPNFDACLMLRPGKWNLIRYAWGIIRGRIVHLPDVQCRKVQTVEVRARTRAFFHVDGDTVGTPPVRLTLLPNALTVVVPQG